MARTKDETSLDVLRAVWHGYIAMAYPTHRTTCLAWVNRKGDALPALSEESARQMCKDLGLDYVAIPDYLLEGGDAPSGQQTDGISRDAVKRGSVRAFESLAGNAGQPGHHRLSHFISDVRELLLKAQGLFGSRCTDEAWRKATSDARRAAIVPYKKHWRVCRICQLADEQVCPD